MTSPFLVRAAERGLVPDVLIRAGIRSICRRRIREESKGGPAAKQEALMAFIEELRRSPLAVQTGAANEQHYEVPPAFFLRVLGPHLKYSCCLFPSGRESLEAAEAAMLRLTCERAGIADGMEILDLGCGWGSLSLWTAQAMAGCRITAVSNSRSQRHYIEGRCRELSLGNIDVVTADINDLVLMKRFDRIVSVEMFEHLRNYERLLEMLSRHLAPDGRLFVHVFCHRDYAYFYEDEGPDDWMSRHFFTGGLMPSRDLLLYFQKDLAVEEHWQVSGRHYGLTAEHWLRNLDSHRGEILPVMASVYGEANAGLWLQRWRIFFLACAELWAYDGGREWFVSHYRFRQRP